MYKEKIVDVESGEVSFRDFDKDEIAQAKQGEAEALARLAKQNELLAKRKEVLDKLGLTTEEAQALLG